MLTREFTHWDDIVCRLERLGRSEEEIMARRAVIEKKWRAIALYRKASEWQESEDGKRMAIQPEDLLELSPVARTGLTTPELRAIDLRMAAMSGTVRHGTAWTAWQWIRWGAPWLLLGGGIGAIITAAICARIP